MVPQNVTFRVDDATKSWMGTYNYIHMRQMVYGVYNWEYVLGQAYK